MKKIDKDNIYGRLLSKDNTADKVSLEELEERMEQEAREEEADNIVLAEDKYIQD